MLDEFHLQPAGCVPRDLHAQLSREIGRVVKGHDPAEPWNHLLQELEALPREFRRPAEGARESPARLPEALDEAAGDWIITGVEHNGDSLGSPFDHERNPGTQRIDQVDVLPFEIPRCLLHHLQIAAAVAYLENELFSLRETHLCETIPQPVDGSQVRASLHDDSDAIDAGLLRFGGKRRGEETASQAPQEGASVHKNSRPAASSRRDGAGRPAGRTYTSGAGMRTRICRGWPGATALGASSTVV